MSGRLVSVEIAFLVYAVVFRLAAIAVGGIY